MLYLVGLGLADETDITVKGLAAVKKADRVYLEAYTSILLVDKEKLVGPMSLAPSFAEWTELTILTAVLGSILWTTINYCRPRNGRIVK